MSDLLEMGLRANPRHFVVIRELNRIGEATGFMNTQDGRLLFRPDEDLRAGDWLAEKDSNERFYITGVNPQNDFDGSPVAKIVLFETQRAYERHEAGVQLVRMLEEMAEAISTLNDREMSPEDRKQARTLLSQLQQILSSLPAGAAGGIAGQIAGRLFGMLGS